MSVALPGLTPQMVEDSDTLMPPGASWFRKAPVDILEGSGRFTIQTLKARCLNALDS